MGSFVFVVLRERRPLDSPRTLRRPLCPFPFLCSAVEVRFRPLVVGRRRRRSRLSRVSRAPRVCVRPVVIVVLSRLVQIHLTFPRSFLSARLSSADCRRPRVRCRCPFSLYILTCHLRRARANINCAWTGRWPCMSVPSVGGVLPSNKYRWRTCAGSGQQLSRPWALKLVSSSQVFPLPLASF